MLASKLALFPRASGRIYRWEFRRRRAKKLEKAVEGPLNKKFVIIVNTRIN
jgi:hypothetical protein